MWVLKRQNTVSAKWYSTACFQPSVSLLFFMLLLWSARNTSEVKVTQSCLTLCDSMDYSPWNSPGQNTAVGSLFLLQGIIPTQGLNWGLLHCRQILYQLSYQENSRILEWVAYPFTIGSSWPRNRTEVSRIAGGFFTNWAMKEHKEIQFSNILRGDSHIMYLYLFLNHHQKNQSCIFNPVLGLLKFAYI